ncbi:MAG: pilus assembly PilX N-terminal domain-containing protein [Thermodesulfobacteriota bacterium]|nr:pilus assembly PilX N-terminal domain-containing protein [Thermodesulfobacteriota bacterium]
MSNLIHKNEKGFVLPVGLMFLAIIAILGTTAVITTTTDLKIGSNYKTSVQTFYDADAGVQYVLKQLAIDLDDSDSDTVDLTADTISLNYSTPSGFSFTVPTVLTSLGSDQYSFKVTGHGPNNSQAVIEVVFSTEQKSIFDYGLFTNGLLDLKSDAKIYSYDSRDTPDPDTTTFPGASTGEADIGSNTEINTKMSTYIDGDLGLGADSSDPPVDAIWTDTGTPTVTGTSGNVGHVDPDPLGTNDSSSELYNKFNDIITTNNNVTAKDGSVCPLGGATAIALSNGETMTLTAGDYYITSIVLKNGSTLEIDATSGSVNIYLSGILDTEDGELESKNGSALNNLSQPTDFSIFSNSSQDITFKHSTAFKGMVYAPNAHVEMKNTAGVYGLIWGNTATIHNSGEFYFDEAIKDKYLSLNNYTINVLSWKDDL